MDTWLEWLTRSPKQAMCLLARLWSISKLITKRLSSIQRRYLPVKDGREKDLNGIRAQSCVFPNIRTNGAMSVDRGTCVRTGVQQT
jgi:hypothetical protein